MLVGLDDGDLGSVSVNSYSRAVLTSFFFFQSFLVL